ncbi:MAG TPA: hypothetical protein VJJ82_04855, partial [Candidatus Nanoarchaeia archaeon]|nr:hypothetical protein [Candidatus Nanoarchaeia archaeon]
MKPQIFALLLLFIIVSCSAPLSSSSGKAVESSGQEHPPISITSGLDRTTFDRIYEYDPVDKKYYAEGKNFRLEVTDRNELMIYGPNDLDTDVVYEDNAGRLYDNSYLIYTYKIGSTPPQVGRARGDHATQLPYVDSEMDTSQVSVPPPQPTPTIAPKPVTPASPGGAGDADAKNAMAQAAASAIGAVNKAEKHSSADTNLARNRDGTYTADGKTFRLVQSSGNPQEQRYETAHGFGQEYFVLIVTETGYAIGRYNGKNELADIKQVTTNTKTSPQPEVTPNPIIAHQFEAAVRDGTLSLTRQSAQGSALTSAEVTALERATRSEKPESVYINTKGQVSNNEEYGSQLIPLPLAQVLASQEGATVRKEGKSWSFVMPPNIQTSGFVFKNFVTEEKVITPHGGTWTETVETTRESCTSCDEKTGARTFEGKTGLSLEYEPVKVGKDPSEVKVLKSSTLEFFNSRDTIGASVITAYLDKAALTDRITKSKSLSEAEKKYKLGQIKNLPENYRAQGDIKVTTNQPGYGVGINEEGDYVELDSDGNLLDDGNHKLSKGDARARLTSGLADPDVADNALRNMADQALNRGIHGVSFSIGFARLEFGVLDVLYTLGPARSLGFLLRSYEQYNGLAKVTSLTWAPGWNREALARQFCLGAGIENCLVSATCGQIHEITADNVLAGRGPGGELVSSASLNAQRSGPINVSGLTRQQILDIMGNTTVMKGR